MNAGPAHLTQDEEAIKSAIKGFASSLDDGDFENLFSYYTVADFESRKAKYELAKEESDPVAPVHYFRLSQILRDLLFTCSSIDFGFEMSKRSYDLNLEFPGIRLYTLNQSMLTPLWKGAGMPYVGIAHGSDTNYIFNGLFPEGQVSKEDQQLSKTVTEAFIRFASTGNPNNQESDEYETWSEAFPKPGEQIGQSTLQRLLVQVIGGPLGTGATYPLREHSDMSVSSVHDTLNSESGAQQILKGFEIGAMFSKASHLRSEVLAREKLLERCAFVNSLSEKLGV
jgi:hypothetical protein